MPDKPILAIDTSTGPCSVAVWTGGRVAAYVAQERPVMQSKSLVPMIEDALKQSGLTYRDLAKVLSTVGPGSFTGIRVGLATARAIAFSAGIKSEGYTTLEVLAHAAGEGHVLAILNAGKGEWYYQGFENGRASYAPRLAALEQALAETAFPAIVAGNTEAATNATLAAHTHCGVTFPRADMLASLAAAGTSQPQDLSPFYIRAPDAKLPSKKNA